MSNSRGLIVLSVIALVMSGRIVEAQTAFEISVSTDQAQYFLGQHVYASVEACNPTSETVTDYYPGLCDRDQFQIFDQNTAVLVAYSDFSPWCTPYSIPVELAPGECQSIEVWEWHQIEGSSPNNAVGGQVAPGQYFMVANFFGTASGPANFEILSERQAAPVPTLGTLGLLGFVLILGTLGVLLVRQNGSA